MSAGRERPLILLLGRGGQVGTELRHTLAPISDVVAWGREEANLAEPGLFRSVVDELKPDVIVNAAAYTAVDRAESEQTLAMAVNAEAPGVLASCAKNNDALLVHFSTDYVFDGTKEQPYTESDETSPVNAYGATKLAGEKAIEASECRHLIFRTTWVYSWTGGNFLKTMLRLGRERSEISVVNDQFGAPTWARMIAEATALAVAQLVRDPDSAPSGIYNLTAAGRTSWHGFATEIFRLARELELPEPLAIEKVNAIPTHEFPTPAKRPANSEFTHDKLWKHFQLRLPDWDASLKAMMQRPT